MDERILHDPVIARNCLGMLEKWGTPVPELGPDYWVCDGKLWHKNKAGQVVFLDDYFEYMDNFRQSAEVE